MAKVGNCIQAYKINSFQKLRVLLHLYEKPDQSESVPDLAKQLFLESEDLLETMLQELQSTGLLTCSYNSCVLNHTEKIDNCLYCLSGAFEDPLLRQKLLDEVKRNVAQHKEEIKTSCAQCALRSKSKNAIALNV